MTQARHAATIWFFSILLGLGVGVPMTGAAQGVRPSALNQPMTPAERARGCAVVEAAWPELAAAFKSDHKPRILFTSKTPTRYFTSDEAAVGGRKEWKEYQGAWKFIWRREISDSRPPSPTLYQRWRRTADSSAFECADLARARSIQSVAKVPMSPGLGVRLDDIYVSVAIPVVSADGLSALVYAQLEEGIGYSGVLTHLAKVKGEWRVVGQRTIDAAMV